MPTDMTRVLQGLVAGVGFLGAGAILKNAEEGQVEGLTTAPECPGSLDVAPGDSIKLSGLAVGNHRFMCCIHPWMRALVKVKEHSGKKRGH